MSNQEILEKAIQKAIDGGFEYKNISVNDNDYGDWFFQIGAPAKNMDGIWYSRENNIEKLIFNHDFAKALWGEERDLKDVQYTLELGDGEVTTPIYRLNIPLWRWHLQQMVIAEDPIKYLGDNL